MSKKKKSRATLAASHGRATRPRLCRNNLKNLKAIDAATSINIQEALKKITDNDIVRSLQKHESKVQIETGT